MQRKSRPLRGRPPDIAEIREHKSSARKKDGARLQKALLAAGFSSQAEAARRSGVPQRSLNQIIAGERSLNREDLRKLADIGISADYVLGDTDEIIPPRQTLNRAQLAAAVAKHISREVAILFSKTPYGGPRVTPALFRVEGQELLYELVMRRFEEEVTTLEAIEHAANRRQRRSRKLAAQYTADDIELLRDAWRERPRIRNERALLADQPEKKRSTRHRKTPSNKAN